MLTSAPPSATAPTSQTLLFTANCGGCGSPLATHRIDLEGRPATIRLNVSIPPYCPRCADELELDGGLETGAPPVRRAAPHLRLLPGSPS